ncbi:MAG: hypothetical protein ABSF70_13045 [Terracidiphilus sp.]|jgi:hypothetical protein
MKKVVSRTAAYLAVFVMFAPTAQADPSPSVRYLMNEQVSMFEWGIFLLQTHVEHFAWNRGLNVRSQFAHVEYDWQKNELGIKLVVYPAYQSLQQATARQACGSLMSQMKTLLGADPKMPEIREMQGIGTFFHHKQFESGDVPKTLDADLEAITSLEINVMESKNDNAPFHQAISCSSELLKPEIRYFTTSLAPPKQ